MLGGVPDRSVHLEGGAGRQRGGVAAGDLRGGDILRGRRRIIGDRRSGGVKERTGELERDRHVR